MAAAQDIVTALDALIKAKIEGAATLDELSNKVLGEINVSTLTTLGELTNLRMTWAGIAAIQEGGGEATSVVL